MAKKKNDERRAATQAERDEMDRGRTERGESPRTTAGPEQQATDLEREGMDLLGRSSVRDDAIPGVSDSSARADQRAGDYEGAGQVGERAGVRRNPPQRDATAGMGEGGVSASGGVAGGTRGHGGSADSVPSLDGGSQPAQHKATSRFDLDHPSRSERDETVRRDDPER